MATALAFDGFGPFQDYLGRVWSSPFRADYQQALNAFLPVMAIEHKEHFDQAHDSGGKAWPPLAPSTVKRKGHDTILVDKGDLRRSLTQVGAQENIAKTTGQGLIFGTSDFKAPFHQSGTSRMPARPPVGISERRVNQLAELIADSAVEQILNIA